MPKQYLVCCLAAILMLLAACGGDSAPQAAPFNRFDAQTVLESLRSAGFGVQNERRDMIVPQGIPVTFSDRYLFEVEQIAPAGGQLLIFNNAGGLADWQAFIERQRGNSATRRDYVYVYTAANTILILSPNMTTDLALAYRDAMTRLVES